MRVRVESRDRIRGVASVNGCGLGYVLVAVYQQYAVTAAAIVVTGDKWSADDKCLADVSPMGMGMGINRGVGTKEAQVCTRSRSTMTSLRVQRPFPARKKQ